MQEVMKFIGDYGLAMTMAGCCIVGAWRLLSWLRGLVDRGINEFGPMVKELFNAHIRLLNSLGEQMPAFGERLERHSDILDKTHAVATETHERVEEIHKSLAERVAERRAMRAEPMGG